MTDRLVFLFLIIILNGCASTLHEYTLKGNQSLFDSLDREGPLNTFSCSDKKYKAHLTKKYFDDEGLIIALDQKVLQRFFKVKLPKMHYIEFGKISLGKFSFFKKHSNFKSMNKKIVINYEDLVYFQDPHGHAQIKTKLCTHFFSEKSEPGFKKN